LPAAAEPRPITLEEALRRAEEISPSGRTISLAVERARAEVSATGLWPNPELSLVREESAGTVERFENLSVPILLTGRLGLERASARKGLTAEEASARQERVSLRGRVREAFLDLLQLRQRTSSLETGRLRLLELVEVLRLREREGESSGFDRMRAERELADVEVDLLEARGDLEGARAALAALVALPAEGLIAEGTLDPSGTPPGREEVRSLAQRRGDVLALDAQAERADLLARAARRRAVPEPSITIGRKATEEGGPEDAGPVLGLAFAIPLFDRGQGTHGSAAAEAALLRARREALARQAVAEAEAAYAEVGARREAEESYAAAGDPEELVTIARAAYEGGEMRILELLDAYRTALAVRLRTLELRAAARKAEVGLGRAVGAEVLP
jgi:cobalt-zinc-cadmium efflux system outer membrane protein